jgi:mono/diheme cytochrome c family protein
MGQTTIRYASRLPVYFALALLVVFTAVLIFLFVNSGTGEESVGANDVPPATIMALLEAADPANGAALVEQLGCVACHRLGAEHGIAPSFVGVGERAGQRHPPMSAAEYLYESVTNPMAFVVTGYNPAMPQDYRNRLSDRELGDIIAYLLSADAH